MIIIIEGLKKTGVTLVTPVSLIYCCYSKLNLRLWRSTLPSVSTIRCSPVKKGWHLLHSSTRNSSLVEPVIKVAPQEQVIVASL